MRRMTIIEAVREALRLEMRRDARVWALGADLSVGGIYGQYSGLIEEFGSERIVSTPISEAAMVGVGVGASLIGTRPVVEMRMADFALCAMDELVNQAAKIRFMSGGQAECPLVLRMPQGISGNSAAQHSQSLESWYAHVPGLVVVAPSQPCNAGGLLSAAIRCDDPVVFLEPRDNYDIMGLVPEIIEPIEIGKANLLKRGNDITIVTWSSCVGLVLEAAMEAENSGIKSDVIDLCSLWPWDREAVLASVCNTGRLLVVHEAVKDAGFGGEVVATVAEGLMSRSLKAKRLAAPRVPSPYSPPLENAMKITKQSVLDAIISLLDGSKTSTPDELSRDPNRKFTWPLPHTLR